MQDAWLQLDQKTDDVRVREPLAYFYRTVRNLAIDGIRRHAREQRDFGEDIGAATHVVADDAPNAERRMLAEEDVRLVKEVLADLPSRQREAIELHRFGGLKMREIAVRFGISVAMVHHLIAEGLKACDRRRNGE